MSIQEIDFSGELLGIGPVSQYEDQTGYDLLSQPIEIAPIMDTVTFKPNRYYEKYQLMHKVIVGREGAATLEAIHGSLKEETLPRYLVAAGWAAAEASLILSDRSRKERSELFESGVEAWEKALKTQRVINSFGPGPLKEHSFPHRIALDLASAPIISGMIKGEIDRDLLEEVFVDCLNIAQSNAVMINIASQNNDIDALNDHLGLGYECNALLALNRCLSKEWFAIPSLARADTGYHHRQQTHDLLIVHEDDDGKYRTIPVEIKSSASRRDRERYKALLVRGKMHLSLEGKYAPRDTLEAIEAVYEGRASAREQETAHEITNRFIEMIGDYCAGEALGWTATHKSVTVFHSNEHVAANHPGVSNP